MEKKEVDVKEKKHILHTTSESQKSSTYFQSFRLCPSDDFFVLIE